MPPVAEYDVPEITDNDYMIKDGNVSLTNLDDNRNATKSIDDNNGYLSKPTNKSAGKKPLNGYGKNKKTYNNNKNNFKTTTTESTFTDNEEETSDNPDEENEDTTDNPDEKQNEESNDENEEEEEEKKAKLQKEKKRKEKLQQQTTTTTTPAPPHQMMLPPPMFPPFMFPPGMPFPPPPIPPPYPYPAPYSYPPLPYGPAMYRSNYLPKVPNTSPAPITNVVQNTPSPSPYRIPVQNPQYSQYQQSPQSAAIPISHYQTSSTPAAAPVTHYQPTSPPTGISLSYQQPNTRYSYGPQVQSQPQPQPYRPPIVAYPASVVKRPPSNQNVIPTNSPMPVTQKSPYYPSRPVYPYPRPYMTDEITKTISITMDNGFTNGYYPHYKRQDLTKTNTQQYPMPDVNNNNNIIQTDINLGDANPVQQYTPPNVNVVQVEHQYVPPNTVPGYLQSIQPNNYILNTPNQENKKVKLSSIDVF